MKAPNLPNQPQSILELAIAVGARIISKEGAKPYLPEHLKPKVPKAVEQETEAPLFHHLFIADQKPDEVQEEIKNTGEEKPDEAENGHLKSPSEMRWDVKQLRVIGLIYFGIWVAKNLMQGLLVPEMFGIPFLGEFCHLIHLELPGDINTFSRGEKLPRSIRRQAGKKLDLHFMKYLEGYSRPSDNPTPDTPSPDTLPLDFPLPDTQPPMEQQLLFRMPEVELVKIFKMTPAEQKEACEKLFKSIDRQLRRKGVKDEDMSIAPGGEHFGKEFYDSLAKVSPNLARAFLQLSHALFLPDSGIDRSEFWRYFKLIPIMPPDDLRKHLHGKIIWIEAN